MRLGLRVLLPAITVRGFRRSMTSFKMLAIELSEDKEGKRVK